MRCDCCHKKKKWLESFAEIETENGIINLCVDCNDLAYKIRDDAIAKNQKKYDEHVAELEKREKDSTQFYLQWKDSFLKSHETFLGNRDLTED